MGNLKLSLFLAYKSIIKGNRWALVLIVMVMSLSFANLILTPSILSGVTKALDEQQINTLFSNIVIDPQPDKYYIDHVSLIEKQLEQYPGVTGVSSHLNNQGTIEYKWIEKRSPNDKGISGAWQIIGVSPEKEALVTTISDYIIEGSYLSSEDTSQILLGIEIAGGEKAQTSSFLTLQGAHAGDKVRVTYANSISREYTIKGIFQAHEMSRADRQAFVTRREMLSVMGKDAFNDRASQIMVNVIPDGNEAQYIADFKSSGIPGEIRHWREYGGAMSGVVNSFDAIAGLISGIGLVVAGIVMFIVIYINVINKKRQIGILRAIGINRRVIMYSYIMQALLFAAIGVICGGLLFGFGIKPYFDRFPIELPIGMVSLAIKPVTIQYAVMGILSASILAGIVPVSYITRQSIIKAIWGN